MLMISKTSIKYMDYYLPTQTITIEDVLTLNQDSDGKISGEDSADYIKHFKEKSGLDQITCFDQISDINKAVCKMMDNLFETTNISPEDIKFLVCGNPMLMYEKFSILHYIYHKYMLVNATILPLFEHCGSTTIAMGLSGKILDCNNDKEEYMLVLSGGKAPDIKNRYTGYAILGDGISLILIENTTGSINISKWLTFSNGYSSYQRIKNPSIDNYKSTYLLKKNIIKNGVSFLKRVFDNKDFDDFDIIIPPNTHKEVWREIYPGMLNISSEKFFVDNIGYGGHIGDMDLIRNLKDYIEKNKTKKQTMKIVVYAVALSCTFDLDYHAVVLDIKSDE